MLTHPFEPVFTSRSRILILGSFPSVKSRENGFYYGHPQNRFWRVMAFLMNAKTPASVDEKIELLDRGGIALWDAAVSCNIVGSLDSHLRNVRPTDLSIIFSSAPIQAVFANGQTAYRLYHRFDENLFDVPCAALPSTSPANAAFTLDKLCAAWFEALEPYAGFGNGQRKAEDALTD